VQKELHSIIEKKTIPDAKVLSGELQGLFEDFTITLISSAF